MNSRVPRDYLRRLNNFNERVAAISLPERKWRAVSRTAIGGINQHGELDPVYSRRVALDIPATDLLDESLPTALESVLSLIDPAWLEVERRKTFRLPNEYISNSIVLVGGELVAPTWQKPQRFAHALLLSMDHIHKENALDFWSLPVLASELAILGSNLTYIPELGPAASAKLQALPSMPDEMVASTIYELLVGIAFLSRGIPLQMLPTSHVKSPEYRCEALDCFVECKRRRTSKHFFSEAHSAQRLFEAIRSVLDSAYSHVAIEAEFSAPIAKVSESEFRDVIRPLLQDALEEPTVTTGWGTVCCRALPYVSMFPNGTRAYAPNVLERAFSWKQDDGLWDGIVCTVEPPPGVFVTEAREPNCLKWRCVHPDSILRRSRGVSERLADALEQIPDGGTGLVYLCYEEPGADVVADARTLRIIRELADWRHRPTITTPFILVNRVYARPLGVGQPDLLDNTFLARAAGVSPVVEKVVPSQAFVTEYWRE